MKTLFLIRHAKSNWDDSALDDRDRPLNDRGKRDAPKMGRRLAKRNVAPDLILSSPALRAHSTAELIADELGYKRKRIVVDERMYASTPKQLLGIVGSLDDDVSTVLMFGHNPEFSALAHSFSDAIGELPTCAVAEFTFDVAHWEEIDAGTLAFAQLDYPKRGE